jgi:hypothetical protein
VVQHLAHGTVAEELHPALAAQVGVRAVIGVQRRLDLGHLDEDGVAHLLNLVAV